MSLSGYAGKRELRKRAIIAVLIVVAIIGSGLAVSRQIGPEIVVAQSIRTEEPPAVLLYANDPAAAASIVAEDQAVKTNGVRRSDEVLGLASALGQSLAAMSNSDAPSPDNRPAPVPVVATATPVPATAVPATPVPPSPVPPSPVVVPVVPTAAPTQPAVVQVAAVAPASTRGPAGVVSQIPSSVWRWLDANGWSIEWRQGPGPGRVSEAQYATSTIVVWYDTNRSDTFWAGAIGHELGHAVSFRHFSSQQMSEWNAMRGLSSWRWVPGTPNDFSVGEGDFAEAFMSYLLGHGIRSVGGPLTQEHRAWIAANTPF